MPSLSQLSYGPLKLRHCSSELEIPSHVDACGLVVSRRCEPQLNGGSSDRQRRWEQVRRAQRPAVGGDDIDLAFAVDTADEPMRTATVADARDGNDLASV